MFLPSTYMQARKDLEKPDTLSKRCLCSSVMHASAALHAAPPSKLPILGPESRRLSSRSAYSDSVFRLQHVVLSNGAKYHNCARRSSWRHDKLVICPDRPGVGTLPRL